MEYAQGDKIGGLIITETFLSDWFVTLFLWGLVIQAVTLLLLLYFLWCWWEAGR